MRCAELIAGALALGGCMRIYPDSELPDVAVTWSDFDCERAPGSMIDGALVGVADPSERFELTAPCSDLAMTFVDVRPARWQLVGSVRDPTRRAAGGFEEEVDLRAGIDKPTRVYFDVELGNFEVAWTFAAGATCASLAADTVQLDFEPVDEAVQWSEALMCEDARFHGEAPAGTYRVHLHAYARGHEAAVLPEPLQVELTEDGFTDGGTVVLSPR